MKVCIATTYPEKMHENGMEDALSHSKTMKKLLQGYSKKCTSYGSVFLFFDKNILKKPFEDLTKEREKGYNKKDEAISNPKDE